MWGALQSTETLASITALSPQLSHHAQGSVGQKDMPQEPGKEECDAVTTFLRDCHITVNTFPRPPQQTCCSAHDTKTLGFTVWLRLSKLTSAREYECRFQSTSHVGP